MNRLTRKLQFIGEHRFTCEPQFTGELSNRMSTMQNWARKEYFGPCTFAAAGFPGVVFAGASTGLSFTSCEYLALCLSFAGVLQRSEIVGTLSKSRCGPYGRNDVRTPRNDLRTNGWKRNGIFSTRIQEVRAGSATDFF